MTSSITEQNTYDREAELKELDLSKLGVKGVLDSGLKTIPRIFHQPPENLPCKNHKEMQFVPVIDMSQDRSKVVEQVRKMSSTLGFFQVTNHGVDVKMIDSVLDGVKKFFEMDNEYKMRLNSRKAEAGKGVAYYTNVDLVHSKAPRWRDTLQVRMSPIEPNWEAVPEMCRQVLKDWDKEVARLGDDLLSILCDGLGVKSDKLKEFMESRSSLSHYYPPCPQPELTMGTTPHTDPVVLSVLVQNEVGGLLQAKCGDDWITVEAIPGAIVINIGDLLQIMSNGEYISAEHRVLANPEEVARVSVVVFLNKGKDEQLYGPFPELVCTEKPAVYTVVTYSDYMRKFSTRELAGKELIDFYRIDKTKG